MEKQRLLTAEELSSLIRTSLKGVVPDESIDIHVSHNFESDAVYFNLKIRYPSMDALCPSRT